MEQREMKVNQKQYQRKSMRGSVTRREIGKPTYRDRQEAQQIETQMEYGSEKQIHNTRGRARDPELTPGEKPKKNDESNFMLKECKMMSGMLGNGSGGKRVE